MKKILSLFLALSLTAAALAGCADGGATASASSTPASSGTAESETVAYVPLDDRPDNAERVTYLAESLGYTLLTPEEDWYQTRLDGQPLNENGTQYGDRAALYAWVLEQETKGCDRYILSLDQLLSGGLVSSRAMVGENPVTLSDGTALSEPQLLESLLRALSADPNNQVWLLDTVMRLAPTVGYGGFGLNEYNVLRTYGMESRPALAGDDLSVENIVADYTLSPSGELIAVRSETPLPDDAVKNYLAARERKLRLSDEVQQLLSGAGYERFRLLIGIDDSSSEDSIQKNEIALLRQGLRTAGDARDWLLSGVDDLGFKAVTKLYLEESHWAGAGAAVRYYGDTEGQSACAYDYQPLTDIMAEHLDFFGLSQPQGEDAGSLEILVLTQPADEGKKESYYSALIDRLKENEAHQRPTILIDAGNGAYGTAFHDALSEQCNLGWLLSYSGFLDMAIVTGTALSHGVARYARLDNGFGWDEGSEAAFLRTLSDSILKDFCYKNTVREELIAYVRDTLSGSPDNFYNPPIDADAMHAELSTRMEKSTRSVLKNFSHSNFITAIHPYALRGCGELTLSDFSFPWNRVFEIRMTIGVGDPVSPHKKILFFYT